MVPLLALVLAGGTSGGLVWKFPTGVDPAPFALADRGGQLYVECSGDRFGLLSAFDSTPVTPVWQSVHGIAENRLRCARDSNVALRSSQRSLGPDGPVQSFLQLYTSSSPAPVWIHAFPQQDVPAPNFDVTPDGRTVVSAFTAAGPPAVTTIRVHDPDTGVPLRAFDLPTTAGLRIGLSSDGSTLAITGGTTIQRITRVLDLRSEATLLEAEGQLPERQAISRDGGVVAIMLHPSFGPSTLRVFARGRHGYDLVLEPSTRSLNPLVACAVSDDGSTVAASWYDYRYPQRATVRTFDVASRTQTMEDVIVTNYLDTPAHGLALCADGSRLVVGCWGGSLGDNIAELRLYSRDRDVPLAEYPAGGSVQDVDISPDGRRFAASRGSTHFQTGNHQSFVELYEQRDGDLALRGRPSIGSTITLEAHATPGADAYLLSARALAPAPIDVPGVGALYLDPTTLARRPLGPVPQSGVVTLPVSIPNEPAAVGEKYYYQLLATDPRALGRDFAQVTILP